MLIYIVVHVCTIDAVWCLGTDCVQFARSLAAARAASVLDVNLQTLSHCVFAPADGTHASDRLDSFVSSLYSQLLQSVTYLINRSVFTFQHHLFLTLTELLLSASLTNFFPWM